MARFLNSWQLIAKFERLTKMMKRIALLFVLLIASTGIRAREFTGKVFLRDTTLLEGDFVMIYCPSLGTGTLTDDEGKYRLIIKRVVQNESLHARRDLGKGLSGGVGNILTEPVDMIWKYPGPVIPAMLARTEKSDVFEIHFQAFANKVLGSGQELCVGRTATYDKNLTGSALATDIHKSFKAMNGTNRLTLRIFNVSCTDHRRDQFLGTGRVFQVEHSAH